MHRAKKDAAEAVGEAAGVCRHNESQRWLEMRVGSPEDCCRDPPPSCRSIRRALKPRRVRYKYKGDLLQVVNAPGGSGKTLALATLLAEQEEIRSREPGAASAAPPQLHEVYAEHQAELPRLPIPPLDETLERFMRAATPLLALRGGTAAVNESTPPRWWPRSGRLRILGLCLDIEILDIEILVKALTARQRFSFTLKEFSAWPDKTGRITSKS
ncbi:hypothetical protein EMIHUDRAFT_247089 [Emiliania huxleyi CCMP1516]|uniref:Uncharacterized protein n=2 Tax=Emiliania huxleyi TaxID=2903 RepID=A0A0D3IPP8_EMIH1|nr:hypothetical protein EMIHUDRAFT_247089 [Emiliania huxleyi CCMP1516]EOD13233.1 hypothetical protein EMIHUDRAFT_247089 [Emiliania huxleyi CCMP1516]|eukprot:XP_005765662.1 hypothetical protein EMIHUDRAFT_247089 [Emiliania huxleyi CCMP1516]